MILLCQEFPLKVFKIEDVAYRNFAATVPVEKSSQLFDTTPKSRKSEKI